MASMIERGGYVPQIVTSGREALAAISEDAPDLVLLDIRMPEMDGYEVLRRIILDPVASDVPVIFVTAVGYRDDLNGIESSGARAFLVKPIKVRQLLDIIAEHV